MFPDNLKKMLRLRRMSQQELADAVGVSNQSVSSWATGQKMPRMKMLMKLCDVLDCPLEALIEEEPFTIRKEVDLALNKLDDMQLIQVLNYAKFLGDMK